MDETYPKLRSDLIVSSETEGDKVIYTIKEPITDRFFRLRAPEYYLLTRADGKTSPARAAQLAQERFGVAIPPEAVTVFFGKMERFLFFEGPALERERPRLSRRAVVGQHRSLGTIRLKAFDPDALLSTAMRPLRVLFRPPALIVAAGLVIAAGLIVLGQTAVWSGSYAGLWRLSSLPFLFLGIFVIGFVHEFGHALTLKYYGGSVREMGFLLLYFQPCFYCNLSDAYLLKDRRAKIIVGLAGLLFQAVFTALLVIIWRLVTPGTLLGNFLYVTVAFSLAIFLFNFNPLIRLDGYYLLADWLRMPNLRAKAFSYWRRLTAEWTLGKAGPGSAPARRERRVFQWYGILAAVYTGVLLGWVLYHVTRFVHSHWGPAGTLVLYAVVFLMAFRARTTMDESTSTSETSAERETAAPAAGRWIKPAILWGGLILIIAALFLIKAERHVGSVCHVEPSARFTVYSSSSGTLETELVEGDEQMRRERSLLLAVSADFSAVNYVTRVAEGDSVAIGDTVLVLSSNLFQANLEQKQSEREQTIAERNLLLSGPKKDQVMTLRAEIDEIEAQLENKRVEAKRADQLLERGAIAQDAYDVIQTDVKVLEAQLAAKNSELSLLISDPKAEELAVKDAQIAGLEASIAFLQSQIDASIVRSPIAGTVAQLDRGDVLVEVADTDPVRVELDVHERDIADVRTEFPVSLKVRSLPFDRFSGRVSQIAAIADTIDGNPHFRVRTEIANPDHALKAGMTGYAKIACGKRSLASLIFRRLVQFIRVEFWSWW
jgi:putative peptide zinc metalloprotease protein